MNAHDTSIHGTRAALYSLAAVAQTYVGDIVAEAVLAGTDRAKASVHLANVRYRLDRMMRQLERAEAAVSAVQDAE